MGVYEFTREGALSVSKDKFTQISGFEMTNPDKLFIYQNANNTGKDNISDETVFYKRYFEPKVVDERSIVYGDFHYQKGLKANFSSSISDLLNSYSVDSENLLLYPKKDTKVIYNYSNKITTCQNGTKLKEGIKYHIILFLI